MKKEKELYEYATCVRRHLHTHPELSMEEYETTEFLCKEMQEMGCEVTRWDDLTGAVGLIRGVKPGPTIAIRADIDALPIQEESEYLYPSETPGVMHACGHDGHTAIALATGKYFASHKDTLVGNIKLLFQPGEEQLPGGAKPMIQKGALEEPKVDAIFALHHVCILPEGDFGVYPCEALIGVSRFKIVLDGAGGYGGEPHMGSDGILAATELMEKIRGNLTQYFSPEEPALITFGTIKGGEFAGGLAGQVSIEGAARTFCAKTWSSMQDYLNDILGKFSREKSIKVKLDFEEGYPPVYNDFDAAWLVKESAVESVGRNHVHVIRGPLAGSDDMAFFLQEVPGCYFWWGVAPKDGGEMHAHGSVFNFRDEALAPAISVMIGAVERALTHFDGDKHKEEK